MPKFWIRMPEGVMKDARQRKQLSYETVARRLDIGMRTYQRWENDNRVDGKYVTRLAEVLDLDIQLPERAQVLLDNGAVEFSHHPTRTEIAAQLAALHAGIDELKEMLRRQEDDRPAVSG